MKYTVWLAIILLVSMITGCGQSTSVPELSQAVSNTNEDGVTLTVQFPEGWFSDASSSAGTVSLVNQESLQESINGDIVELEPGQIMLSVQLYDPLLLGHNVLQAAEFYLATLSSMRDAEIVFGEEGLTLKEEDEISEIDEFTLNDMEAAIGTVDFSENVRFTIIALDDGGDYIIMLMAATFIEESEENRKFFETIITAANYTMPESE